MKTAYYEQIKDRMKTGDLLQWRSNSLVGGLIRWRTGSIFNHSSLVLRLQEYEGAEHRRYTTEALEHGTVLNFLSRRLEKYDGEVWWCPLKDEWESRRQEIGERALSLIGIPYDYKSLIKQIIGKVSAEATSLFCSEYCYLSYGLTGTAPTPADMLDLKIFKSPLKL